ncbi:hypothetical protein [Aeoliella mucimassa]|uniref:Tetratricopeptide repeat protein n=1 Tax=Aeoliella mucimassa TaxID=2527972 RepID=A0A518AL57_9BACT|nr:hypothetical protein [Aeoliella mucimassa]QDU55457.1 hypothetical protein Pan181_16460 [Aeoliella mucimassa]
MTQLPRILFLCIAFVSLMSFIGCSGDAGDPNLRRSAEELHASGLQAFEQGDYQKAFDDLGMAAKGGLNPDLYSEALVYHAVAAVHLNQLDVAQADFEILDQGATNMDEVLAAKSFWAEKQGNKAQAKQFMQQAKQIDRQVKSFGG